MTSQNNDDHKPPIAEESAKTLRDRRKLLARFNDVDEQITREALDNCVFRIRERINRLAALRVPLGNSFELFDSNRHPKDLSDRVKKIATSIREMLGHKELGK